DTMMPAAAKPQTHLLSIEVPSEHSAAQSAGCSSHDHMARTSCGTDQARDCKAVMLSAHHSADPGQRSPSEAAGGTAAASLPGRILVASPTLLVSKQKAA